jgi:signal transduction histidine kinase
MRIRTRLTLWFAAVLIISLLAVGALSYYELVLEPRENARIARASGKPLEPEDPPLNEIGEALLTCGIPALILGLGGGWWLMRRALAPVTALTNAVERVNEHHLQVRLPRTGNGDELDRLTDVFNRMTGRLDQSFSRIREFTLHASHELKTPLTVIHGELETALQNGPLSPPQRARLESELDEIQRLTRIVDGLTLLTKADAGQINLARETVRLDELAREACSDGQSLARPNRIQVSLGACEGLSIVGDRHRLRQLLLNLTDNAIKYNQPQGTVSLSLVRAGQQAELTIANTGPGIAADVLSRVFDPFFRGDASHSDAVEGCGLGLSIARWIVTAHSGTIEIKSTPGALTTVVVRLPLAAVEPQRGAVYASAK